MKRKLILLFFVPVLLLTACKSDGKEKVVEDEVTEVQAESSSEIVQEETESMEDFSMPKPKFDPTKYEDLLARAEQMGYDLPNIETFATGFSFKEFSAMGGDKLTIIYHIPDEEDFRDDFEVTFTITPKGEKNYEADPIQKQEDVQIEGVDITTYLYVHLELCPGWESMVTEEQQQMLDDGRAGSGIDDYWDEVKQHNNYTMMWQEKNYEVCLVNEMAFTKEISKELLDQVAKEWITTSQK